MRHLRFGVAVAALALCAASVAVAHETKHGGGVVTPVHKVAGMTGGELLGEAWFQLLSNPNGTFSGGCMPLGRKGKVQVPEPGPDFTSACTVKKGTKLFIFFGSSCSDVEPPPFFGADEEEQRACAIAAGEFFTAASISVDGRKPVDFRKRRFELISPQRTVDLPEDNYLGVPAQEATFVAHGWEVLIRGLRRGEHTIEVVVTDVEGVSTTFTASIEVVRGGHHDD
jgi:hypothetical protein